MTIKHVSVFHTRFGGRKSPAHATVATWLFPDSMPRTLIGGWVDSAAILLQSRYRRAKSAPAAVTIDALAFAAEIGTRQSVEPANVIRAVSDAELNAEIKRRAAEKSEKPGKRKPGKRHPAQPTAQPTGTTVPPTESGGDGDGSEKRQ